MYLKHFGLDEKPFSITPDPDYLYMSEKHSQALATLEYGVFEQSGITVITGDVGTGKTTLLRHLLFRLPYNELTVGLVSNIHRSLGELLQWVCIAFKLDCEGASNLTIFSKLQEFFRNEHAAGKRVVLVMDEAQNMDSSNLEELRMLSNINSEKEDLLQIVLLGQPQLMEMLVRPSMAQIAQRVTAEYHLEPLSLAETEEYVANRLTTAGGSHDLFATSAVEIVHYVSGGVPRLINTLCDHALVTAFASGAHQVTHEHVAQSINEKRIGGVQRFPSGGAGGSRHPAASAGVGWHRRGGARHPRQVPGFWRCAWTRRQIKRAKRRPQRQRRGRRLTVSAISCSGWALVHS